MEERIKSKQGFLLGKFLPPHEGHMHLIRTAMSMTEQLWILVCTIKAEPIPGALRYRWIKEEFPGAHVVHIAEEVPQSPEESEDFWPIWLNIFQRYGPPNPDTVFTSELYGEEIARRMGIIHVLVDLERKTVPVSGTLIRNNPFQYWEYIPPNVRPYFLKKIVLIGPESTGKTVLSEKLAEYFQTTYVSEYAREFWPSLAGRKLQYEDISTIAKGQLQAEELLMRNATKILICDTDLIATEIWSEIYFDHCPDWIKELNRQLKYDLYLLMNIDIPWVDDGTREFPDLRESHFKRIKEELDRRGLKYVIISGTYEERFERAVEELNRLMKVH